MPDNLLFQADKFMDSFKARAISVISEFNGEKWEKKTFTHMTPSEEKDSGSESSYRHEVNVSRGSVFEKATVSEIVIKYKKPSEFMIERGLAKEGDPVDIRVIQVEIFPRSSKIPMGHLNIERLDARKDIINTNFDVFPASTPEDVIEGVRKKMKAVAEKYGYDHEKLSAGLQKQYNMEEWEKPLSAGAGIQLKMLNLSRAMGIAKEGAETLLSSYADIVRKHKDEEESGKDKLRMNEMRAHWMEYLFLKDGAVKMARARNHPFGAIRLMGMPPTVHY